jgi:TRAP-type C4-dicarboxylate transport system permease large subunit
MATLFLHPLPVWDYWYLLLLPLCAAVAIVYKAMRCRSLADVPREAAQTTGWILLAMLTAGAVLLIITKWAAR